MNKKIAAAIAGIVAVGLIGYTVFSFTGTTSKIDKTDDSDFVEITDEANFLFKAFAKKDDITIKDGQRIWNLIRIELDPARMDLYNEIGNIDNSQNAAVIIPIFTATAYKEPGFYTYYRQECDSSCLTRPITNEYTDQSSVHAIQVFQLLNYEIISDLDVERNPDILSKFDKVILLHNEYVTRNEFDAIMSHPKVVYLYPNALYAEIKVNADNTITLLRGHNYPEAQIRNGFDWEYDNSILEYDTDCSNMRFEQIPNGIMLNCYPENEILFNPDLLRLIKEF